MSKPDPLKVLKEPLGSQPPEPGDAAYYMDYMRPSSDFPYKKKYVKVLDVNMAYVDEGKGKPIVFIHGAPESAYVWRNIMPWLLPYGRIIAPDLIGHGNTDKPDVEYTYPDHIKYLDAFFEVMKLTDMTFVIHDWGTNLGLYYACRFPKKVRGIAMMETLCAPFYPIRSIAEAKKRKNKAGAIAHYQLYQQDDGWDLAVNQNLFVEQVLMIHTHRKLTQREMDAYRDPFRKAEWRRPIYMWARQVSLEGNVPFTDQAMEKYNKWLLETDIPILDIYGYPGEVTEEYDVKWRAERCKNHEAAFIGTALHFVQEDQPERTGRAIADWYRRNLAPNKNVWFTNAQP